MKDQFNYLYLLPFVEPPPTIWLCTCHCEISAHITHTYKCQSCLRLIEDPTTGYPQIIALCERAELAGYTGIETEIYQ